MVLVLMLEVLLVTHRCPHPQLGRLGGELHLSLIPSTFQKSLLHPLPTDTYDSMAYPRDTLGLSNSENLTNSSKFSGNGSDLYKHAVEKDMGNLDNRHPFYSQKQNEDFAALEQHIEDLTQEKFSLQRALEASLTLAESLAAENSTLTDSYNQQENFGAYF
ncbi:hypothetical protein R3W88_025665 [Solanum pinnatisectum]|uniref:Uncharacterized protein n=1 Tax=Solanum pinnatisectum TaxID=50273 RepID=A0AAV9M5J4_9SOLN|nr:hypothetical protein R3W88_025665 [Solanum pinnatisectum]